MVMVEVLVMVAVVVVTIVVVVAVVVAVVAGSATQNIVIQNIMGFFISEGPRDASIIHEAEKGRIFLYTPERGKDRYSQSGLWPQIG